MTLTPIVEVVGLRKSYRGLRVLDGVDLSIEAGRILALLGPNGSGKTTTVGILSTLRRPDAGRVRVAGFDVVAQPDGVRSVISLTGQFTAVDELLTGRENLRMMARLHRLPGREIASRVADSLSRFGLTEAADRRAGSYSGGMRRRLDLAIGVLSKPRVLFLDEPTTGLDPHSRREVWRAVTELAAQGVAVLLTTQYLEEADQLADRVAVLNDGRIIAEGTPAELKRLVGADLVEVRYADGTLRRVPTDGTIPGLQAILADLAAQDARVTSVAVRPPSMDDVFLQLTGRPTAAAAREEVAA
ncbi:ABC-2 type transport system ATP-binding protein [Stackebrandtia albiflava]|uniref:ABC-2 type transport system ATP-binding protein n=1 Tax=Stackebrandtia albiflava TaxID=406432 RepID=A0A562VCH0_9ACTN|nr:ATP-binding cassette domain-containing protein [Stackebrandtia albiflava]TWJ15593.1 ABC-2 type transport system ATP-binding protein [Stackebrandtia albiflava]